jgi:hypothetical protein
MKKIILGIILAAFISNGLTKSQTSPDEMSVTLEKLYGRLISRSEDIDRLRINDSIKSIIESYVASDKVFTHRFSNLRYLGQISSSDSLIRIITWNLILKNEPSRYFCYFIRRSINGNANSVYRLIRSYDEKPIMTDTIYNQSNWYGALYYDIKPSFTDNKRCWVLLGINYSNPLITRKIIEVLSFTPENNLIFGKKWFHSDGNLKYRHVFEYSANGIMSLRFKSESSIVFDHLVPLPPSENDDHLYYGPDYSFDAYIYQKGLWNLTINVDARNKE